jgi:hypothetical protein
VLFATKSLDLVAQPAVKQIGVEERGGHLPHHSSLPVQMVLATGALERRHCHNRRWRVAHPDFPRVLGLVRDALVEKRLAAHTQTEEGNVPQELDCYLEDLTEAQTVQGFEASAHTLNSLTRALTDHQLQTRMAGSACGLSLFLASLLFGLLIGQRPAMVFHWDTRWVRIGRNQWNQRTQKMQATEIALRPVAALTSAAQTSGCERIYFGS